MSSLDRMLRVLDLFAAERPHWTVEQAMTRTGFSRSTVYRYFKSLTAAGLVSPGPDGAYSLGPAVIGLDRLIRLYDPLLATARGQLAELARSLALVTVVQPYRDQVVVTHVEAAPGLATPPDLVRGLSASLFDSAAARVVLAHESVRRLRRIYDVSAPAIAEAGLGTSWTAFRQSLRVQRRVGFAVHRGQGPLGALSVAVPVFGEGERVIAAIAAPSRDMDAATVGGLLVRASRRIAAQMMDGQPPTPETLARASAALWRPSSPINRAVQMVTA
ncbi:IclR family transcriptional regulator [Zavarzinia sp.]|uniref:IclR family transcriptional regulator n=1 Tax=Zavarzinia sp. TaxID=2027920 RepID=UPI003BB57D67|nr:helix-turn-helix domain-containing protein [Zavarzinia sp.]